MSIPKFPIYSLTLHILVSPCFNAFVLLHYIHFILINWLQLECQEYGSENDDAYDDFIAGEGDSLAIKLNQALKDHVIDGLEEPDDTYKAPTPDVIQKCVYYAKKYENETEDSNEDVVVFEESSDESEKWDCETIVSTYSNLDNHPGKIEAPGMTRKKMFAETCSEALNAPNHIISLRGKEKLPVDFLPHVRKAATEKVKGVTSSNLEIEKPKSRQHEQESKEKKKERKVSCSLQFIIFIYQSLTIASCFL